MALTEADVRDRLREITDPQLDDDIVSLDLVNDIEITDGTIRISLAFNTPFAPAETEIGNKIRSALSDTGLTTELRAEVSDVPGFDTDVFPNIRNIIAVASGKGGVGKTTIAANIAAGFEERGARVGLLDADIHGPNVLRVLSVDDDPGVTPDDKIAPPVSEGVKVMSMGLMLRNQDDPAIMRGPMVNNVMTHFIENVEWEQLDYLIVDLPPGTGDASLDLLQSLPVTGAVIVTIPQQMAIDDAKKGLRFFEKHDTPILGLIENMRHFQCPTCDDIHDPFGHEGAALIEEEYEVPILGSLPIHEDFGADGSTLPVVKRKESPIQGTMHDVVTSILDRIGAVNRETVSRSPEPDVDDPLVTE